MEMDFAKEMCKIGQGADCCRYLTGGQTGLECAKLTGLRAVIDARAATMTAQSDNCPGDWGNYAGDTRADFERDIAEMSNADRAFFMDKVRSELRGKDLACWCELDQACHADVLLELANA